MEQPVVRSVLADDKRRVLVARPIGVMDNGIRRQRSSKRTDGAEAVNRLSLIGGNL